MNILFLTPRESGTNLGGVERHVRLVTEELVKRGHKVKELPLDSLFKGQALPRQGLAFAFKFRAWGYLWRNRELFRWAEVVHVHDVFWWYAPFAIINKGLALLRQQGQALVSVTFHGWEGVYPPSRSAVWQKRLAARLSDGTIGVGDFYEKWYGVKTDKVVWGVLDQRIAKINKGPAFDYKGRALGTGGRIVFLGRLEEVNGIEVVIEGVAKINKGPALPRQGRAFGSMIFVGDGSWRSQAEKVGKVTGMVAEPWRYLADASVVIASSYLAILEAAGMGKPVIAIANNPLKRDYLEGHPMRKYFRVAGNAEELAEELHNGLYKGPAFDYKGRAFASGQTAGKLADVYEELWNLKLA